MSLALVVALAVSTDAPTGPADHAPPPGDAVDHAAGGHFLVELPFAMSSQGTASRVETVLTPWAGLRVGWLSTGDAGFYVGADAAVLVGAEAGGTGQVSLGKVPMLVEARGLVGGRFRAGLFGAGVYGYGGAGAGGGVVTISAFEDTATRGFTTWTARAGGGGELTFGVASLRLELGAGARDARLDLHGAVAAGLRF